MSIVDDAVNLKKERRRDAAIGLLGAGFACVLLFIWIPNDIETGVIDTWRRAVRIGDPMLPTFAVGRILLASIATFIQSLLAGARVEYRPVSINFVSILFVIMILS